MVRDHGGSESERVGGTAAWAPSHLPPRGVELSPAQELACAVRHLDIVGFSENMTGHVSWQQPGNDTLLVNPWGFWWREATGSSILEVDLDGAVVSGDWDVTPAIHIHTELHRRRPDARVVVHSHPMNAAVLAAVPELPEIVHQNSSILSDEMVLVDDYDGEVDTPLAGGALADAIGDRSVALLVSHGVIVTAPTMQEAVYKSVLFERTCEMHWRLRAFGQKATPIAPVFQNQLKASLIERAADVYWDGAIRQLVATEPDVLD
ncbi:MAG: class II aldolase/adducin family protein [Acidimicrobiales bacterium]|jgi:ribulose-5-phosphate 4-epimerase/fuculose-1-phosphate aldolase|nr:class II aldolase/adducin family protein [Acidimicrobiales bacterium]